MPSVPLTLLLLGGTVLLFATPAAAFGAGNIVSVSQVAGKNWRHGDIEDTLLELFLSQTGNKKFDKLNVQRVYFGNWLRDYSQAVDVGGLKQLPKDAIRVLLWILSFMTFGFATGEFEVTEERLGCYRPEEHIDNPKDYADNEDARKYDSRLRGPVDERKELAVDERTGLKAYIASEDRGMDTSAGLVRKKFEEAIEKGRAYGRDGRKVDLYEALRLLGTGLHCLEDYAAHSNYCELALRELGAQVYPHVGERTELEVNGKRIFPVTTGTFGMTDFLHSVLGEVSDKMVQSEVQDLNSKLTNASDPSKSSEATSTLKGILDNVPWALLGIGGDFGSEADQLQQNANAKQMEQTSIQPKTDIAGYNVEEMKRQTEQTVKDIFPILEFHDKVMKAFLSGIDKIPGASALVENLTGAMQIYIFSILAPYIKPILERTKAELAAGSGGVLAASEKAQFNVFEDENCSDPTHSVLSKDHFTNLLNPVAGRVASATVSFVVPLIVGAWDDGNRDPRQVIDEILQVFHHPALRDENKPGQGAMFGAVKQWWEEKDDGRKHYLGEVLSKQGVRDGKNHEGEDPNPGPGGCGHSHKGMPGGGGTAAHSSGGQQSHHSGNESSSYGGAHEGSSYDPSGRNREETSSYGGMGGGYSSTRSDNKPASYGQSGGRDLGSCRQQTPYGSGSNREETSPYSGTSTGYSSRRNEDDAGSYGSSRRGGDSYESTSGGYGPTGQDLYGSSRRRGEDDENASDSYGHIEASSYGTGSVGRGDSSSYSRGARENASSYSRDNQTSSYGRSGRGEDTISSSYERSDRAGDNASSLYGRSGRDQETTSSYGRSGRDEETTSAYGRSGRGEETTSFGRSGFSDDNTTSSYGRPTGGDHDTGTSTYGRNTTSHGNNDNISFYSRSRREDGTTTSSIGHSGRNNDDEDSSDRRGNQSYGRDTERGSSRRNGEEGQSYGLRGGGGRDDEQESSGYGY